VSPVYAAELILRCLGFDSRRDHSFTQAPLNKTQLEQRDTLLIPFGETQVWRPVVSVSHIIYGLIKAGEGREAYFQTAHNLAFDFGLVPETKAAYADAEMNRVERATRQLLSGAISPAQFASGLLGD
jgi:hypothetical protein